MKRILSIAIFMIFATNLVSLAETQTVTKTYSNKYFEVNLKQPVYTPASTTLPETETEKKIKKTKENIETTQKSISDIKKTWGLK